MIFKTGDSEVCPLIMVREFALERLKKGVNYNSDLPFHRSGEGNNDFIKVPDIVRWLRVVDTLHAFSKFSLSFYSVR